MIHSERSPNLPNFFVRLLCTYQVIYAEHNRQQIPNALSLDLHSRPEARVQRSCNPCGTEVGARVEICERFGAFETDELAKVASNVQVEESDEDRLPDCEFSREKCRDATKDRRAMTVAPAKTLVFRQHVIPLDTTCL